MENKKRLGLIVLISLLLLLVTLYCGALLAKNISNKNCNNSLAIQRKSNDNLYEQNSSPSSNYLTDFLYKRLEKSENEKENILDTMDDVIISKYQVEMKNSNLKAIDNDWNLYTNNKLGFSIKIPQKSFSESCTLQYLNKYPVITNRLVPILPYDNGSSVFIRFAYTNSFTNETDETSQLRDISNCKIALTSIEKIKNSDDFEWEIKIVSEISSEEKLAEYVKNEYGSACSISKKHSSQEGVYDIEIIGDEKNPEESNCYIGGDFALKYYPKKQKLANWDIGQYERFIFSSDEEAGTNDIITQSFKFN